DIGEGLIGCRGTALHRRFGDICHPMRRPQALEVVGLTDAVVDDRGVVVLRRLLFAQALIAAHFEAPTLSSSAVGAAFSRLAIHWAIAATATSRGTPLSWVRSPKRKLTALASTSRSPATSMNGTFWLVWLTIFLAIRSSLASTSARTPCIFSCVARPFRYGTWSSATGIPTTWTGAS